MPALPNAKHERFVLELLAGKSQSEAYLAAGYSAKSVAVASAAATRLLKDPTIAARLEELQAAAAAKAALSKSWVLEKLRENVERAMQATPVLDRDGKPTGEYVYQGSVANRALELIGKEQGMFIDRKEIGEPGDFKRLSDDELDAEIAELQKAVAQSGDATKH